MNVAFFMAARSRIVYNGQRELLASMLDKPDNDEVVAALTSAEQKYRGDPDKAPLDAIELLIAERVDAGEQLPVTNPEAYMAAQWLAQGDLGNLPDPIPRGFVLYIAAAWAKAGKYPSLTAALSDILATRSFV